MPCLCHARLLGGQETNSGPLFKFKDEKPLARQQLVVAVRMPYKQQEWSPTTTQGIVPHWCCYHSSGEGARRQVTTYAHQLSY